MDDVGGSSISVNSFVAARAQEIAALSLQISASSSVENKGLAFQHVPKHMRRRAVSHNVKRLPKRLQNAHMGQLAKSSGGPTKKPKKPSRKHRRRKTNLLSEYNRRQRTVKWLETHIWHAKRFKMAAKWNHKIPMSPCDKGYRAIYRAFRDYSAMRDLSFWSCLELSGPYSEYISVRFRGISVDPLGIGASFYKSRTREGKLHLYTESQFPLGYIGEIRFFWIKENVLWLWVHPGFKDEVIAQLVKTFELSPQLQFEKEQPSTSQQSSLDQIKLEPKHINSPPRWSSKDDDVTLTDLYGALNRIRLIGEGTFPILKEVLRTSPVLRTHRERGESWFHDFYEDKAESLTLQGLMWDAAENSHDFACQTVIPMTVRDPRILLPQTRAKYLEESASKPETQNGENFVQLRNSYLETFTNPLTESDLRERLVQEKMSDLELTKRRGQLLIPGSELELGDDENQVPIILIRQQGTGWDLILPPGWALGFWIALSYRCVRAFGYRDARHYAFEFGSVHSVEFPQPDSLFGQAEAKIEENEAKQKFFSYPPAKRENLVMLKCPFPFQIDWDLLLKYSTSNKFSFALNWQNRFDPQVKIGVDNSGCRIRILTFLPDTSDSYFIMRDDKLLKMLDQALRNTQSTSNRPGAEFQYYPIKYASRCLVGVGLTMLRKGRPSGQALICIPDTESEVEAPAKTATEEPGSCRKVELARKERKQKHEKRMAFLRKKRKKIKKRGLDGDEDSENIKTAVQDYDSTALSAEFNEEMQSLYIPNTELALKASSKSVIGAITIGGEAYRLGKCRAFGYVTYLGLSALLKHTESWSKKNIVWVRDATKSLEYRQAKIEQFKILYGTLMTRASAFFQNFEII